MQDRNDMITYIAIGFEPEPEERHQSFIGVPLDPMIHEKLRNATTIQR